MHHDDPEDVSLARGRGVSEEGKAGEEGRRLRIWDNVFTLGGEKFLLASQFVAQVFSLAVAALGPPAHCHHASTERCPVGGQRCTLSEP